MSAPANVVYVDGGPNVSADNLNTFVQWADIASTLRTFIGTTNMLVVLEGITSVNDGQGGIFYWDASGTEPDDNYNYVVPTGASSGEWVRLGIPSASSSTSFALAAYAGALTATGTNQATAYAMEASVDVFTTVATGTGAILPYQDSKGNAITAGTGVRVLNRGANTLLVYPPVGSRIESLALNTAVSIVLNSAALFIFAGSSLWYTP